MRPPCWAATSHKPTQVLSLVSPAALQQPAPWAPGPWPLERTARRGRSALRAADKWPPKCAGVYEGG